MSRTVTETRAEEQCKEEMVERCSTVPDTECRTETSEQCETVTNKVSSFQSDFFTCFFI